MLPTQFIIWLVMFPLAVLSFFVVTSIKTFIFLFNCPVDIWTIIGRGLEEAELEEKNKKQ